MVNLKEILSSATNVLSFVLLQLLVSDIIGQNCFIYIGSIIFLDWSRSNIVWHMLMAFGVGFFFDIAFHTLGVHTFSLVLITYVKYYILMLFIPGYGRDKVHMTIRGLGLNKIIFYIIMLVLIFYVSLFTLSMCKNIFFTTSIIKNIFLCSGLLFLSQLLMSIIDFIFDER